jgi:hypothetical protein
MRYVNAIKNLGLKQTKKGYLNKIKILKDIWLITHMKDTITVPYLGKLNQVGHKSPLLK